MWWLALIQGAAGFASFLEGQEQEKGYRSRGDFLAEEARFDAARYREQAKGFKAKQAVAYGKSGVMLTGSPLDILAETERISGENAQAIEMQGRFAQMEQYALGTQAASGGRSAMLGGATQAGSTMSQGAQNRGKVNYYNSLYQTTQQTTSTNIPRYGGLG